MPNQTVECNCPFVTPMLLGAVLAALAGYALDKALPTEDELLRRERELRANRDATTAAKRARSLLPARTNGSHMSIPDRLVAAGW